jgi:hypothetical protein
MKPLVDVTGCPLVFKYSKRLSRSRKDILWSWMHYRCDKENGDGSHIEDILTFVMGFLS